MTKGFRYFSKNFDSRKREHLLKFEKFKRMRHINRVKQGSSMVLLKHIFIINERGVLLLPRKFFESIRQFIWFWIQSPIDYLPKPFNFIRISKHFQTHYDLQRQHIKKSTKFVSSRYEERRTEAALTHRCKEGINSELTSSLNVFCTFSGKSLSQRDFSHPNKAHSILK